MESQRIPAYGFRLQFGGAGRSKWLLVGLYMSRGIVDATFKLAYYLLAA